LRNRGGGDALKALAVYNDSQLSLDHLVGAAEQREWNSEAERLGSLEIEDQLNLHCLLDRQVGRLLALENPAYVNASVMS
jgi:hypothetical protein